MSSGIPNGISVLPDGWYPPGVTPTPGERYEFEDFIGARFTATLASWCDIPMEDIDGRTVIGLRLNFRRRRFGRHCSPRHSSGTSAARRATTPC